MPKAAHSEAGDPRLHELGLTLGSPQCWFGFLFLQGRLPSRASVRGQIDSRTKLRTQHKCLADTQRTALAWRYHSRVRAGIREARSSSRRGLPPASSLPPLFRNWRWSPNSAQRGNPRADEKRGVSSHQGLAQVLSKWVKSVTYTLIVCPR